jgi:Amidohydrolase
MALGPRLAGLGWHLQMLIQAGRLPAITERLLAVPLDLVIDRMGLPSAEARLAGIRLLLPGLATGRAWVKLSAPYDVGSQPRLSAPQPDADASPDHRLANAIARRLFEARPDRMLWGSNCRIRTARRCRTMATSSTGSPRSSRARPGSIRSWRAIPRACMASTPAEQADRRCRQNPLSENGMPILIFLILIIMIAQLGFWDTFSAILGGVAMLVLFVLLAIALLAVAGALILRRIRG